MAYDSREKWLHLGRLWTLAYETELPEYRIPCDSRQDALKLRSALYSCVRRARAARTADPELVSMAESLAITIRDDTLLLYKRSLSPITEKVKAVVEEKAVEDSLGKLKSQLSQLPPGTVIVPEEDSKDDEVSWKRNPYFDRED